MTVAGRPPRASRCSFVARPGRLTGFLGPNGAGKSTAMRAVFGLVSLDSGALRWSGTPITASTRARFGYMPEERGLYPRMRVGEQLVYLGRLSGRSATDAGRIADGWLARLGLSERRMARLDSLSHGNQQRVQLIAALVSEPELLVLDEPFAGLDPIAMATMSDLLTELASAGTTVLFSSHQLDLVEHLCQDVVIIDQGCVVLSGPLADLRAAATQRFVEVTYDGPVPDWSVLGPGAEVDPTRRRARVAVRADADLLELATMARAAGHPATFAYQPPTLSELFRQAVTA